MKKRISLIMGGEHGMNEYGTFSKEVSELLNVNSNTLRRWSIELEKQGYVFERNEKEQRIYYKRDIFALRQLQKMISEKISMVNACTKIASQYINNKELEQTLDVQQQESVQIAVSKEELQSLIEQAIEKEREAMFQAFERKMNDVIERRDRQVTLAMQNTMEEKQKEIAATTENPKKKRWWEKLFSNEKEPPTKQ